MDCCWHFVKLFDWLSLLRLALWGLDYCLGLFERFMMNSLFVVQAFLQNVTCKRMDFDRKKIFLVFIELTLFPSSTKNGFLTNLQLINCWNSLIFPVQTSKFISLTFSFYFPTWMSWDSSKNQESFGSSFVRFDFTSYWFLADFGMQKKPHLSYNLVVACMYWYDEVSFGIYRFDYALNWGESMLFRVLLLTYLL